MNEKWQQTTDQEKLAGMFAKDRFDAVINPADSCLLFPLREHVEFKFGPI